MVQVGRRGGPGLIGRPSGMVPPVAGDELTDEERATWFAYMRVLLRMEHEMHHQLQAEAGLSLTDFHVLNALADSPGRRLQLTALAARIGFERSRTSHHVKRMGERGLVRREPSAADARATDALLTEAGLEALRAATPGHVAWVRTLFFDGLDPALLEPLRGALEQIHAQVLAHGTLPDPGPPQRDFAER